MTTSDDDRNTGGKPALVLSRYFPYKLSVLAQQIGFAVADVYARRFNLSRQEWRVLAVLGGTTSIATRDIGKITTLDKMEISRAMRRLEIRGIVARDLDSVDRRNKIVRLTSAGRAIYEQIVPLALERENALLAALSPTEIESLDRMVAKLTAAARALHRS
ncbi:MAG: winged helix DNA-binding protein [Proteobacteria bacterium]|nr:winged helix DNA-binding protein [Pseudomonadota bacterium]